MARGVLCAAFGFAALPAAAQVILEDWACGAARHISNSNPAIVTCDTPHHLGPRTAAGQPWVMYLRQATGAWAAVNGLHAVRILNPDQFAIPVDTTPFGPFEGQSVSILRGNHLAVGQDVINGALTVAGYGGVRLSSRVAEHNILEVIVPDGYTTTANQRCTGHPIAAFSVSQGVATVLMEKPIPRDSGGRKVDPGREIHFRNLSDPRLNSTAYKGSAGADQPHYIAEIADGGLSLRVPVAVPDGQYAGDGGGPPLLVVCPKNIFNFMYFTRQEGTAFPYPEGRVSNYVKNPPLPLTTNRLRFWIQWGRDIDRRADGSFLATVGTYAKSPEDPESIAERFHFYHQLNPNFYAGRWMFIEVNATPQHCRSAVGNAGWPNEPMLSGWPVYSSPGWDGRRAPYLPNLTYFYFDTVFDQRDFSGQVVRMAPIIMDSEEGEPDAYVASITAVWAPRRFNGRGPGYEVTFAAPKMFPTEYEFRYSTRESLKTAGFSSGTAGGVLKSLNSAYSTLLWTSPPMEEQDNIWIGIRPHIGVMGVSGAGIKPIVVTTLTQMLARDGDRVRIQGVQGNAAANSNDAPVTNRPAPIWFLDSGLKRISVDNGLATVELTAPHGLVPGQVVHVYGTPDEKLGMRDPHKYHSVLAAPTPNTFTLAVKGAANGVYATDRTKVERLSVRVLPSFSIPATGSGEYAGGGTIVSLEDFRNFTEIHVQPFASGGPVSPSGGASRGRPGTVRPPRTGRSR